MALSQFSLISWYWLKKEKAAFSTLGLLLFLWLLTPLNHLYTSNMLEGTLTLFTTIASLLLLVKTKSKSAFFVQYFIGSVAVIIAFFCNGPTAFFPLAIPFIRGMIEKDSSLYQGMKETIIFGLLLTLVLASFYLLVPDALINTQQYFQQQLLASVIGLRQLNYVGLKHLNILYLLFRACSPISIFSLLCVIASAKITGCRVIKELKTRFTDRNFLLFFLLALVSSLPVGVSHRQAFNYIMQSAPFITLAMMWICYEPMQVIVNYCYSKSVFYLRIVRVSYCIFAGCFAAVISLGNGYNRHETMLKDIDYLTHFYKKNAIISTSPGVFYSWYTGAYFSRNSMISITPSEGQTFYLALKNEPIPDSYRLIDAPLSFYNMARHV